MDLNSELPLEGKRLKLSGSLGTIRFVGDVDNTSGIWLGVEWDDPRRGKHDGVKDGKRTPNSGSFIRPSASVCYGHSFLRALTSKYIQHPHGATTRETVLLGSSKGAIEVEAVGLDKIRGKFANLQKLREVSLDGENVAASDPPGEIRKICPHVRGLDLSLTLLPSWDVVALIATELHFLERLSLNQCRLQPFKEIHRANSAFLTLTDLQLNSTLMSWQEMQDVTAYMPNLRLVEFGYNHLVTLSPPSSPPSLGSSIQTINLDSNQCHEWYQICQGLEPYKCLQRLVLKSNHINEIPLFQDQSLQLQSLRQLSLSFNCLRSWSDVDSLSRWCPRLESLSLVGNPVVEDRDTARYSRQLTVARIPSLLTLEAVAISRKERVDCERFYMSYIVQNGPFSEDDRCREHPRWKELCTQHGRPEENANANSRSDKLSDRIIQINIYQFSSPAQEVSTKNSCLSPPRHLRVLPTMSLRIFRLKVLKLIRNSSGGTGSIQLWLKMKDGELVQMDTEHDNQDIAWWGIEHDSDVLYHIGN